MSKKIKTEITYIEFVLMNGKTIEIEIPEDNEEEIWEEILVNFHSQGLWSCDNWANLKAHYQGKELTYIDFHKVLGIG